MAALWLLAQDGAQPSMSVIALSHEHGQDKLRRGHGPRGRQPWRRICTPARARRQGLQREPEALTGEIRCSEWNYGAKVVPSSEVKHWAFENVPLSAWTVTFPADVIT